MAPTRETRGGTVRVADSRNFTVSTTVAAALLTIRPGGLREMHWHPNADEWQYYISGEAQMTVFNVGPKAVTQKITPKIEVLMEDLYDRGDRQRPYFERIDVSLK